MGRLIFRGVAPCVAFVFLAMPAIAGAQTKGTIKKVPAAQTSPSDGSEMYASYCAACHGKTGKGDGPAAAALKNKPSDLTVLSKAHNGKFSSKDFEDKIRGDQMTAAHGSVDMPIWGPIFKSLGNDQLRVYNLKKYVDTLQAP